MLTLFRKPKIVPPPEAACAVEEDYSHRPPLRQPAAFQRGPAMARALLRALNRLDRAFDYAFKSEYNPLYKSGTLAMGLMALASGTGVILLFYYRIGAPYESMQRIQSSLPLLMLRGVHRYASDLTMVALAFHILRMAAQGKAWGPRALAWVSGVVLLGAVGVIGWTGFVLLGDAAALELALVGAKLLDILPVFPEPMSRAFNGSAPLPSSFYFMNLFGHMSLPLLLLVGMYIHTSKLARSSWLPRREVFVTASLLLCGLALALPPALDAAGDLLAKGSRYSLNLFYNAWVPWVKGAPAWLGLASLAGLALGLASMPWWWRPPQESRPLPSANDPSRCEGCNQCVLDCPFEAVALVPRQGGGGSLNVALVDPALCVSCGLCVGSCDRLSIAPPDRDARDLLAYFGHVKKESPQGGLVFFYCQGNTLGEEMAKDLKGRVSHVVPYELDCLGSLHFNVAMSLLHHFKAVVLLGCPPANCQMREGYGLALERLFEGRKPALPGRMDSSRLLLLSQTAAEKGEALHQLDAFLAAQGLLNSAPAPKPSPYGRVAAGLALAGLTLAATAWLSARPAGKASEGAWLRLALRLPGQAERNCRPYTPEELAALPRHMRKKEKCETRYLSYELVLKVEGKEVAREKVSPQGGRGDRPLVLEKDFEMPEGSKLVQAEFLPLDDPKGQARRLKGDFKAQFRRGRANILLIKEGKLELRS